jgi:hypothetical protein
LGLRRAFRRVGKFFKKGYNVIGRIGGNDPRGNYAAWGGAPSEKTAQAEASEAEDRARREAQRRAHEEEVQSLAAGARERVGGRRRKGVYSTILTGGTPLSYASPKQSSGKTLLGQ